MIDKTTKLAPKMIIDALKKLECLDRKNAIICHPNMYNQIKEILSNNGLEDRCEIKKNDSCNEDKFFIVDSKEADKIKFVKEQPEETVQVKIDKLKIGYWTL